MKFKINQKVWHFDKNIWKPIQDIICGYSDTVEMYLLTNDGGYFEESELFSSKNKCLEHYDKL